VDVCRTLETSVSQVRPSPVPAAWRDDGVSGTCSTVEDVIVGVRRLDRRSDELLSALVRRARSDPLAASTAMVALLPLAMARCASGRGQVDELVGELAIVIGESGCGCVAGTRLANRLVDRAWSRMRRRDQRGRRAVARDPTWLMGSLADSGSDLAESAACRVDLERAVDWLASAGPTFRAASRAWNTVLYLSGVEERSPSARRRLRYARRVLRRSPVAELVA
jgi:hypothetical protein